MSDFTPSWCLSPDNNAYVYMLFIAAWIGRALLESLMRANGSATC